MAVLRQKTKAKKAQLEANAAAADARRAAAESAAAVRDLAQALVAQVRELGIEEKASEAVERIKASEAYGRAQAKADELGKRVAESDAVTVGRENAARRTAATLAALGTWLATGERGKRLGIAQSRRRGVAWVTGLAGVGIGYAVGVLTAPKEGREIREQLMNRGGGGEFDNVAGRIGEWDDTTPPFERPLADQVRTRLGEDPRTSDLPSLNINVVDGTVVVRGSVPDTTDHDAIRDVIFGVEGVQNVDLKLGSAI
ncbi:MAG TPA: BON domain-containing protein [Euzebyales bacterium]|nr:BON domain-containing protein [Euzebyales bacterium]